MPLEQLQSLTDRYLAEDTGLLARRLPTSHVLRKEEMGELKAVVYNLVICLIVQGSKETHVGNQSVSLECGDALLVSHDLPVTSQITEANQEAPYLAISACS